MTSREAGAGQYSYGWHCPVPYLFVGLAAALGLIGFRLLLLACSYWKLPSSSAHAEGGGRGGGAEGDGDGKLQEAAVPCHEETIVVIMAGDEKPTYLATPISWRAPSSFGAHSPDEPKEEDVDV